jgi:Na+/proline symporter
MLILLTVAAYFLALLLFSKFTTPRSDNDTFFRGNRQSPWYMVAFGMVGASISGITFVSVPGMVLRTDMTYLQMCLGFILGYFAVAFILLPLYYRLNLTTIYTYLEGRMGRRAYRTGASFFLLSKMTGAAVRFYVVCMILQEFVFEALGVPFPVTVVAMVALIWLYTRRGGIKTLVWTDTFQTACMFIALILLIFQVTSALHLTPREAVAAIAADGHSRVFEFGDWMSKQHFLKQFLSGVFVTIVMTGLDQDMMQKNLTCKNLREAQKDMCSYAFAFLPANLLFLSLGILLTLLARQQGISLPAQGDDLLPMFAASGLLGSTVVVLFTIGVLAAAFSSADSALTALTTSFCVDICGQQNDERLRRRTHVGMAVVFTLFILAFRVVNSTSVIDAIYILCSYTYGPLLGLFAYGLLTRRPVADRLVPYICVASPLLCYLLDVTVSSTTGYHFGYEMLMINGALTFAGLYLTGRGNRATAQASS